MGFSAKQLQALRRSLNSRQIRTREVNGRELSYIEGWYAISEANRIFGFDGWNRETGTRAASWPGKTVDHSSPSMLPKCALPCRPMERLLSATVMAQRKAAEYRRAKSMTSLSKLPKPMPPNGHSPPSANRLDLSFTARTRAHRCRLCRRTSGRAQIHPRSPVWVHTPTIRHRSRGHHTITGGDTRTR